MTVGPLSLAAGEITGVSYAVVAGSGLADLKTNAQAARALGGTEVAAAEMRAPAETGLRQNYPNPFNPKTTVAFSLREAGTVNLSVYDVHGRLVRTLVDESRGRGEYAVVWEGRDDSGSAVASGIYYCRLVTEAMVETRKMVLLK